MGMPMLRVAQNMLELAQKVFADKDIVRETEHFQVFRIPQGFMDQNALLVWRAGKDFSPTELPGDAYLIPVDLDDRKGYLVGKAFAMQFTPASDSS